MKKKLVLASKVLLGVFLLLLFVIMMGIVYSKTDEAEGWIAVALIMFVVVGAVMMIFLLIETILEVRENWKQRGVRVILELLGELVAVFVILMVCNMFIFKEQHWLRSSLSMAVAITMMQKVLDFWRRVSKSKGYAD